MSRLRIQYYIFKEIAVPTCLAVAVFTFVLLLGKILKLVELVINKGVPLGDIARLFLLLLPSMLVVTLPLSFLLGVMLGFGRLSADGEITACKSTGISLYQLAVPAMVLGLLTSILYGGLTLVIRPASETAFRQKFFQISASRASIALQPNVFNDTAEGLTIYANAIDDRTGNLQGVFLSDERENAVPAIIVAGQGRIVPNRDTLSMILHLNDGVVHRRAAKGRQEDYETLHFTTYDFNLDEASADRPNKGRKPKEMSTAELRAGDSEADAAKRREILAELHTRFALPFAPLLFALIGVPLGLQPQRSGRGGAFALGLFTFLCYYLLSSFAETLLVEGQIPVVVMWMPDLIFLLAGLFLFYRAAEERPLTTFSRIGETFFQALHRIIGRRKTP
jgi:lipopolysaccharide export system permease protein